MNKLILFKKHTKKIILRNYKKNIKLLGLHTVKTYKNIRFNFLMDIKKRIINDNTSDFFSEEMIITKKSLNENQLKYTYQKQLISDLDYKHKEWSKFVDSKL